MNGVERGLSPYVPRLLPELAEGTEGALHRVVDGTLVFADLSGFTALSERFAAAGGKAGAEEMTVVLNDVFGALLDVASARGGEMLKYGGDALLLLFRGDRHAVHAVAAAREMQRTLRSAGRITTDVGRVRLRMSVGVHSGPVDFFVVGPHRELIVAGPVPSVTAAMETAADADEILVSPATAALLPPYCLGDAKGEGVLLRQAPRNVSFVGHVSRDDADLTGYIPEALRATLLAGPVQPQHRPVAMSFVFVELPDPPDLAALDATFTRLVEIFAAYGVTLLATDLAAGGVKLITTAGLPVAQPDAEERTLRAAREVMHASLPLRCKIGVQRGHVFAGTVGPSYRMTFTVIGDVVNTAARLMARADFCEVLTLAPVLEYSTTEFAVDELAPFTAKGKSEPLNPLRVGDALGRRRRTDEVLPIVGRDEQLAILDDALDAIRAGTGGSIDIVGDAGMGKSRLIDEFASHAQALDITVVRAEANELDQGRPYFVAESVMRDVTGARSLAELQRVVARVSPELVDWLPLLALAHGFNCEPTAATERLAPGAVPAKVREVTAAFVAALVRSPAIIVVEDMHWADAPSQRLLSALMSPDAPVLLVVTRRPVDLVASFGDRAAFNLGELPGKAAEEMLDRLLGRPLLPERRAAVLDRAGGNPMFLREFAVAIAAGTEGELPDRIESLIDARIDALSAADRIVIRAAAVVGHEFSEDEVAAAIEEPVPPTTWDRLSSFVAPREEVGRYRFRHALMRDSAYAGLPYRWRSTIHQRVGTFLEAERGGPPQIERMAVHFGVAKDKARAWRYATAAGDRARSRFAFFEAAAFYDTALSCADAELDTEERFRVIDSNAFCLQTYGNLSGALDAIRRGRRLVADGLQRARLQLQEATCLITLGEIDDADRLIRAGLRQTRQHPLDAGAMHTEARLLAMRSRVALARSDLVKARQWGAAAAAVAQRSDDKPGFAHGLAAQYDAEVRLRIPGRDDIGTRAQALFAELGQDADAAVVLTLIGNDRESKGDLVGAVEALTEAETRQVAAGLRLHGAVAAHNRAFILIKQGHLSEAAEVVRSNIDIFSAAGYRHGRTVALSLMADIEALRGDRRAIDALEGLRADAESLGDDSANVRMHLAEAYLFLGEPEKAHENAPDPNAFDSPEEQLRCERLHVLLATWRGDSSDDVRARLDGIIDRAREFDLPFDGAVAESLRAVVDGVDAAAARATLERMGVRSVPALDYLTSLKSA